eukprot:jgi/Bigna1/70797/fgenesh1_pg.13_\
MTFFEEGTHSRLPQNRMTFKAARWLFVCAFFILGSESLVIDLNTEHDGRSVFHITSFGYEEGGVFKMDLKDFVLLVPQSHHNEYREEKTKGGCTQYTWWWLAPVAPIHIHEHGKCFHEDPENLGENDEIISLPYNVVADKAPLEKIIHIKEPGTYHVYFSNCLPGTKIGFKLKLTQYNVVRGERVYLTAGKRVECYHWRDVDDARANEEWPCSNSRASLPALYSTLCLAFLVAFVVWCMYLCKHHQYVVTIHLMMGLVALFKACTLFSEAFEYHVMLVVIVVQAMVNVAMVMLDETAPGAIGWLTWRDLLHLLDMLCCCAILIPIVWSIRHLTQASERDGKAARDAGRLKQFRYTWLANVFSECTSLLFYLGTGWLFRPRGRNPYLKLEGNESDDEEIEMDPQPVSVVDEKA